jgi:hypothetical protein
MSAASVNLSINGAAAVSVSDGTTNRVDPNTLVTVALTTTTGVKRWTLRTAPSPVGNTPHTSLDGFSYEAGNGQPFSVTFTAPPDQSTVILLSEVLDTNNNIFTATITLQVQFSSIGQYHRAAAVQTSNVASLTSAAVLNDGVTLVQGQILLLVGQTSGLQNGPYVVGVVAGGNAPLTRPADFGSGNVYPSPQVWEIEQGTSWGGSTWKTTNTGGLTVDTTVLTLYPRTHRGTGTLAAGTQTISTLRILTGATVVANDTTATAAAINCNTITAGDGNGSVIFKGTLTDTFNYMVVNWG